MKLAGSIAVVTGTARGIGRATAERLLAKGAKVVVSDIDEAGLRRTAAEIGSDAEVLVLRAGVAVQRDVIALVQAAVGRFGAIDTMVNNAGIAPVVDFPDVTEELLSRVLDVNL